MNEDQKPEETQPVGPEAAVADKQSADNVTPETPEAGTPSEQHDLQADQDRAFDEHPDVMAASTPGQGEGPSSRWAGWATGPRRGIAVGALAVLLLGSIGLGGVAVGNAFDGGDDRDRSGRGYDRRDSDRDGDNTTEDLAAAELSELAAAVDAAYPDAVIEALSGSGDGTYWVRIETTDGEDLSLALDEDFDLVETDGADQDADPTEDPTPTDEETQA